MQIVAKIRSRQRACDSDERPFALRDLIELIQPIISRRAQRRRNFVHLRHIAADPHREHKWQPGPRGPLFTKIPYFAPLANLAPLAARFHFRLPPSTLPRYRAIADEQHSIS